MARKAILLVAAVLLSFGACSDPEPAATPEPTRAATAEPTSTREVERIEVTVRAGEVVGGSKRYDIDAGTRVEITVHSDVTDEVHVHGFDEKAEVTAGSFVSIGLVADAPGIYVVELEERKIELLELAVR
jgi:hypothetical protein